jgi:hypothetical protein
MCCALSPLVSQHCEGRAYLSRSTAGGQETIAIMLMRYIWSVLDWQTRQAAIRDYRACGPHGALGRSELESGKPSRKVGLVTPAILSGPFTDFCTQPVRLVSCETSSSRERCQQRPPTDGRASLRVIPSSTVSLGSASFYYLQLLNQQQQVQSLLTRRSGRHSSGSPKAACRSLSQLHSASVTVRLERTIPGVATANGNKAE